MREPAFWRTDGGRSSGSMTRKLLTPLGQLYAAIGARRIQTTTPVHADLPVICVGNLTVGGTGKTPVTQTLLRRLQAMGHRPAALSRGYGGRLAGPIRVRPQSHSASEVGDEPLLLARIADAWISRRRPDGAQAITDDGNADVIVMDDGHQNPTLYKNFSFVVIDGARGWGPGTVFPAGPLREPVKVGLKRADAVIVVTPDAATLPDYEGLGLADLEIPIFQAWLKPETDPPQGPLVAFAGIGRPSKFFDALTAAGAELVETAAFPDHHRYSDRDMKALKLLAERHRARLVTTDKDHVRLRPEQADGITSWSVQAEFANEVALDALLRDVMDA
ncbi:tetraacyldisaccharide 4'-kinase [Maricaulis sp. CAU 1757]